MLIQSQEELAEALAQPVDKNYNKTRNLSMYYALALLTLLVGYYDSWVHHLVVLEPFMIINLIIISYEKNLFIKNIFLLL